MAFCFLVVLMMVYISDGLCNFAEFSLEMEVEPAIFVSLGTFSLSTNRCQSIITLLDIQKFGKQHIKGSLQFECLLDSNQLKLTRYSDEYCSSTYIEDVTTLGIDDEYELIINFIKLNITEIGCSQNNCMVSSAFGQDCTFSESEYYFNISFPPNKCQTLSQNVSSPYETMIENAESQVLPPKFVAELRESSVKFACCDDYSLMIYNYSDGNCTYESNVLRIPNTFNNVCLDISRYRRRRTLLNEYIIGQRRLQSAWEASSLVLSWICDEVIVCPQDISNDLPPKCNDSCGSWSWNPVLSDSPTDMPTINPSVFNSSMIIVPLNDGLGIANSTIVLILIGIIFLLMVILVIIYGIFRNKRMAKQVNSQNNVNQGNIMSKHDSKYAAMIEESMNDNITASVIVPESISNFDNKSNNNSNDINEPLSYENENYIKVETLTHGI